MPRAVEKAIMGKKLGMTAVFDEGGNIVPVTVIEAGPCVVVGKRLKDKDGYEAVQLGFDAVKEKKVSRPLRGQFAKHGLRPVRWIREFALRDGGKLEIGQVLTVDQFKPGDVVDVTGTSKGKGFAGGVKRWGFKRGPMAHGSKYHRRVGSLQSRDAARVFKGRRMPGRLGGERVTVRGLRVVRVDPERRLLLVKGAVPGIRGSLLLVRTSSKAG